MSAKRSAGDRALSAAQKLEQKLAKIKAAERRKFVNEDIVRFEKNGDISYESVRTTSVPLSPHCEPANNFPETPVMPENGKLFDGSGEQQAAESTPAEAAQLRGEPSLADVPLAPSTGSNTPADCQITFHEGQSAGNPSDADAADPLEELLSRALSRPRRGQPAAFDAHGKGKLVALLSLGMSLRQAAAVLGVSHTTIRNTLQADPALAEEITAARFQAQLQPLACVIREARRSWKAATWLLKYLDGKIASHEETPDERRERMNRERDEFFGRPTTIRRKG